MYRILKFNLFNQRCKVHVRGFRLVSRFAIGNERGRVRLTRESLMRARV